MSTCKYGCGTKFGNYDLEKRKFYELDGTTLHTWERHLQVLKSKQQVPNGHNSNTDVSLELVLRKLESIGITLDLTKLRNAVQNGDSK